MDQFGLKAFSDDSHRRTLLWVALFILLLAGAAWATLPAALAQETAPLGAIDGFELLDGQTGWVRRGADLDWTEDGGQTWRRITPPAAEGQDPEQLAAVYFRDATTGWALLWGTGARAGGAALAATADAGASWRVQPLPAGPASALARAKAVHLVALSATEGYIAADLAQSSNFSRGALWYTADGGATWQERSLPLGEAPQFVDAATGWVAGGPRGDGLWRTADGGVTWQAEALPYTPAAGESVQVYTPLFTADGQEEVLPLLVRGQAGQRAAWAALPGGFREASGTLPGSLDARAALLAATGKPLLPPTAPLPFFANTEVGGGLRLAQVKMADPQRGWALATDAHAEGRGPLLLATADGGLTWQPLHLPPVSAPASAAGAGAPPVSAAAPLDTGSRTAIVQGAGFDVCDLPAPAELAAWRNAGPYRTVNLYLGGVLRFCDNERLTAANLAHLTAQGWTFIPTWVGPQAPCSVYRTRFSSDGGAAYAQGAAEAAAALDALRSLGLSEADGSGAVVYYDLESFDGTDQSCIAASQAFVSGWTERLHAAGSQAGLYGSACSPEMARFATISAPPDAVWVAQWNRSAYDPAMTVWNIACLDNTLWARSQRIRQYTGGHDETWGGVTLNIDSNVLDGLVADLSRALAPTPTPTSTSTPTPTPTPTPQPVVVIEAPVLQPPYTGDPCASGWQPIDGGRGHPAYVAPNRRTNGTIPPPATPATPPAAQWSGAVPSSGSYRVEAYIPAHAAVDWECPPARLTRDTSAARYSVQRAEGSEVVPVLVIADQAAASGGWLPLGVFPFAASQPAVVRLETVTGEEEATRTVTAGALRLTRQPDPRPPGFLYLPQIRR